MSDLCIWTITENPSDFPGKFVARRHVVGMGATCDCHVADSLEGVRALLPAGLIMLPREEGDDPVIVESWI